MARQHIVSTKNTDLYSLLLEICKKSSFLTADEILKRLKANGIVWDGHYTTAEIQDALQKLETAKAISITMRCNEESYRGEEGSIWPTEASFVIVSHLC